MRETGKIDYLELPAGGGRIDVVKAFYARAFSWTFTDFGPTYSAFEEGLEGGFDGNPAEGAVKPLPVLLLAIGLSFAAWAIFIKTLGLPFPLFKWPF